MQCLLLLRLLLLLYMCLIIPCVSSFCKRTLASLDLTPDLRQEKNSTNQRAPYIYKLHKFETNLYPFIHIKTIKKHFPGVKFSLLMLSF